MDQTNSTLTDYVMQQVATLGIRPKVVEPEIWVPNLPGAEEKCLGILDQFKKNGFNYTTIAVLRDCKSVVSGHDNGYLRCWDLKSGKLKWTSEEEHKGKNQALNIALSPDQNLIVSGQARDPNIRIWKMEDGSKLLTLKGPTPQKKISWPDKGSIIFIGVHVSDSSGNNYTINTQNWQIKSIPSPHKHRIQGVSPSSNIPYVAIGDNSGLISIWEAKTQKKIKQFQPYKGQIWSIIWSPDLKKILIGYNSGHFIVLKVSNGEILCKKKVSSDGGLTAIDWSPNGNFLAIGERSRGKSRLRIWKTDNYEEITYSSLEIERFSRLQWVANGAFIVSGHFDGTLRFWNTRHLMPSKFIQQRKKVSKQLSATQQNLLSAFLQLIQLEIFAPLSLVRDLILLTGGQKVDSSLDDLAPYLEAFIGLRWPYPARVGLVAWLLEQIPFPDWRVPVEANLATLENTLYQAMQGESIEAEVPDLPISLLTEACKKISPQLLTLLELLGAQAVADDPGLIIRLSEQILAIPKLNNLQRKLLSIRLSFAGKTGQSTGTHPNAERSTIGGIDMGSIQSDWRSLLPGQLVLPDSVFQYKQVRGELLFRSRQVAEPPRLRPTVILLDVSPPVFGPIERITRLAAYAISKSLQEAGLLSILVTSNLKANSKAVIRELRHPADYIEIFTQRSLFPMQTHKSVQLSMALRQSLRKDSGPEPIVLLLTHPWFGAEEELDSVSGLRALFVQYPGRYVHPPISHLCEKWESVNPEQGNSLEQILGRLVG